MRHLVDAVSRVGTCCGLLLAIAGVGARGAQARPAQLAARAFYAISYDSYQRWCLQSAPACAVPRKATTLPAGTRQVGFYFTLDYPTKHAGDMRAILYRLSITIRTGAGTLFTSYHSLARDTPAFQVSQVHLSTGAALIHAPQRQQDTTGSAYPDDTYRADLLIEGKPAAHASFIIGSGHAAPQGTPQARSQIRAFYAASETGYSTWTDFKTVPAPAAVLPSGRDHGGVLLPALVGAVDLAAAPARGAGREEQHAGGRDGHLQRAQPERRLDVYRPHARSLALQRRRLPGGDHRGGHGAGQGLVQRRGLARRRSLARCCPARLPSVPVVV